MPLFVMTDIHYAPIPLFLGSLASLSSYSLIIIPMYCSKKAKGAAALAFSCKSKDKELRS
ncbi:MAG: hypothetical protein HUJ51_00175 [Eggerthellaceae bacterium]|nr:hypothetical protein [Eggerthellaceae bacterium]